MKKRYLVIVLLFAAGLITTQSNAQQDAQYTQYMYNPMAINPAYAGSRDVFSLVGLYRTQWVGLDGAPKTYTISAHTPLSEKVGIGLNITNDQIFVARETYFDASVSYTIQLSQKGQLAFGVKAGGHLLDISSSRANTGPFDPSSEDPLSVFNVDEQFSPQLGAGAYYYTDRFYLGLSVPNILETEHFDESRNTNSTSTAKERVNWYMLTGYVFDLNQDIQFKPASMVKLVEGSPLQVDVSANFRFYEKLTLGVAYRWSAALSGLVGFQLNDQLMLGFGYDRETTELVDFNDGSFEFMLRYELFNRKDRLVSPRFF